MRVLDGAFEAEGEGSEFIRGHCPEFITRPFSEQPIAVTLFKRGVFLSLAADEDYFVWAVGVEVFD